jgi:hypothetical protein
VDPRNPNPSPSFPELLPHNGRRYSISELFDVRHPLISLCVSRDDSTRYRREPHGPADWPPNGHGWTGPSPPVTPVRARSNHAKVTAHSPFYYTRDAPLLSPILSTSPLKSDQLPSARNYSLTPSPELVGSSQNVQEAALPLLSPNGVRKTPGRRSTRRDGVPEGTSLHPDLAAVGCNESRLSNSGNIISNSFSFTC